MRKLLLVGFTYLLCVGLALAQDRTITGKVTDATDGTPLPGVSVSVKGTTKGTTSSSTGTYSLTVGDGDKVLVFSFIGFKAQEVEIGNRSSVDIKLAQDATELSEVVVTTAGGLQARVRELGTSQTILKSQDITGGRAVNLAGGLQGKVAGAQINATSSGVNPDFRIVLRGQRSLTGNNQALVVIDNVIVPSSVLGTLNMNDVESVNILQGAGAAAIYGSQASNGAVIITTKKGKEGKVDITVSQNVQWSQVAFLPKIQEGYGPGGSAYGIGPDGKPVFNYLENQSYGPHFDGTLRPLGPKLEDGSQLYSTYDFKPGHDDFWKIGLINQTDFSLSSGDEKSSFYISGQYVSSKGTTPGDKYSRGNIRVNGTRKVGNTVMVTYSTAYAPDHYDVSSATSNIYSNMLNMPSNVDITQFKDWRTNKFSSPNGFYNPWYQNPYFQADNYRRDERNKYLTGNLEIKFTPIRGLDLIARQGISSRFYTQKQFNGGYKYSDYAKNTDQSSKTDIPASVTETANNSTQLVTDLLGQYDKHFGVINANLVAGTQLIENTGRYLTTGISGLIVDDLYNLSNGTGTPGYAEAEYKTRLVGVYGKLTLGYKDYLFLTASGRNDWDSRLNKENRSFFYPSLEASAILSDIFPEMKASGLINYVKLRGGIAKTGQVNLGGLTGFPGNFSNFGAYYTLPTFSSNVSYGTNNGFPFGSLAGYSVNNSLVSTDLKPEFTHTYEVGLDFNLWNDKITSAVTYFHSRTDNQTVTTSVSNSTGYNALTTNVGETTSKGVEFQLHVTPIKTPDWTVTVGGNYSYLDNKVNSISELLPSLSLATSGNANSSAVAGQSFPVIMGLDYQRDPQGRVIVNKTTGLPSATTSNVILGNATPKNRLGMDAVVNYKNFRFSILFEYRSGYKVFNGIGTELDWSGTGYRTALYGRESFVFPNSVYQDGTNADGSPIYVENTNVTIANGNGNNGFWSDGINRNVTSNYISSGNFLKLREISLSYDLPSKFTGKVLKGANISVQGRNLFLWMAKDNYYTDPEYSSAGVTGNGSGLNDLGQTPPTRYYGATLTLRL
ncbi:SusC/RagA family TonB-linked outer membrane protein [Cytophagaceae bacterium DM2B3-1]|uniref:SusC/RagA family TonB-linked outer membrane protein n=1 Tax=Xanthocytophaga flava TaxID=3048013 RepID=A0ABT7CWG0_9BACT|nr:SusC/RagA family TonB-linked outer membrane protein [Xanthocytophaga flavus]MDJ1498068.1 SusC/RagA family TonB-linked outer membrane protein [Xanthocytophaga flavus]